MIVVPKRFVTKDGVWLLVKTLCSDAAVRVEEISAVVADQHGRAALTLAGTTLQIFTLHDVKEVMEAINGESPDKKAALN